SSAPANARCQSSHDSTTTGSVFGASSSALNARPRNGLTSRTSNSSCVAIADVTRTGASSPPTLACPVRYPATAISVRLRSCSSISSGGESQNLSKSSEGNCDAIRTSRSGSPYGSGRRTTPLSTEKIALLAPMPRARVRTVTNAKAGDLRSERSAYRTSVSSSDMMKTSRDRVCSGPITLAGPRYPTHGRRDELLPPQYRRTAKGCAPSYSAHPRNGEGAWESNPPDRPGRPHGV